MTPQSTFMVLARLERSRIAPLRALLATMNSSPGVVDPENSLIPFAHFDQVHFARFVVLDDQTTGDIKLLYGIDRPEPPVYLAFLGDIDGSYDEFLDALVGNPQASAGLRKIFDFCDGFSAYTKLRNWMAAHEARPAANYNNWVGRTVRQIREEKALRVALRECLDRFPDIAGKPARDVHQLLRSFVQKERKEGRLKLTPPAATPFGWRVKHMFDWVTLIVLIIGGIITSPLTLIPILLIAWRLRAHEKSDPVYAPRPDPRWETKLAVLEDRDVTNQFSVMGALKPGLLRKFLTALVLWIIDLTARLLFTRGRLARVHTIHAARWVYLDGRKRLFFASNYDGSLDSYMDDFINKVGFGLNVVFSNGVSYPHTDWLLFHGAKDEQLFKFCLRRHELPTEVWYNAHAGLTAHDLERNSAIRDGLQKSTLSDDEARAWVALL